MIPKNLKILGLHPRISNFFSQSLEQFFLRVGQNNFGNKIPFLFWYQIYLYKGNLKLAKDLSFWNIAQLYSCFFLIEILLCNFLEYTEKIIYDSSCCTRIAIGPYFYDNSARKHSNSVFKKLNIIHTMNLTMILGNCSKLKNPVSFFY